MRNFALTLIAVPISIIIAVALWSGSGLAVPELKGAAVAIPASVAQRDIELTRASARTEKAIDARRRSGGDALTSRVLVRRPASVDGRALPLVQADDARSWR